MTHPLANPDLPTLATQMLSQGAATLLKRFLGVLAMFATLAVIRNIWTDHLRLADMGSTFGAILLVVCYRELAANRVHRGLVVLCWGLWLLVASFSFLHAGLRSPGLYAIPVLLMTVTWVQGARAALVMAGATLALFVLDYLAQRLAWLPDTPQADLLDYLLLYSLFICLAGSLAIALQSNFRRLYLEEQALNDQLESRVAQRTLELEGANESLTQNILELERMRSELVQAEKLSALGTMVAGISHELNTPLGNAILSTSTMKEHLDNLEASFREGPMRRKQLEAYFSDQRQLVALVERCIKRATTLISSFKDVAIDQASQRRREFDLALVVNETIDTLRPRYRGEPWDITIDIADGIVLDSYPGPVEQIITNLVINCVTHGFEGRASGVIGITAHLEAPVDVRAQQVVLTISDNGVGIDPANLDRVFEPFFTTKLGKGGSGLGLNIVHRIATTILGGSISVSSTAAQGTRFVLRIPREAPRPPV
jgi:signal transduction histidine kinase